MKRVLLVLSIIILLIAGCASKKDQITLTGESVAEYKKINAQEAKVMIENENITILDVRTKEEYEGGHIKGAILLPNTEVKSKAEEVVPDKNVNVLVYCRSGNRSAQAAKVLLELGYTNVYDAGGIIDWPYEVIK